MSRGTLADVFVSAVAVTRDQAAVLPEFVREVSELLEARYANFEIILIDKGSRDKTAEVVRPLLARHKCLRYQRIAGALEDETARTAGLDAAIGDYVALLDPDLDPPGELPAMVEACRGGCDIVLGLDQSPEPPGPVYRLLRAGFLALARWLVGLELPVGTTGLRVFSRHAVNALTRVRARRRYFALLAADIGLGVAVHPYRRRSRSGARPPRHLLQGVRIGLSVLVHYSIVPLRLVGLLGLVGSGLSMLYSLYVVAVFLFKHDVMPGWTTLSLQLSGFFGLLFFMLALLSEYIGRLLEETTERPLYHVQEELSSAVMLSDQERRNVVHQSAEEPARREAAPE